MDTKTDYPWEIKDIPEEELAELSKHKIAPNTNDIRVGPHGYFFPTGFKIEGLEIYNMEIRPSDTFVVTFPKSGTTWTQELVWLIGNDHDYETAAKKLLMERFPFIEFSMFLRDPKIMEWFLNNANADASKEGVEEILKVMSVSTASLLKETPLPRFIKSHLPLSLLPPTLLDTAKVVYVARDPKDVVVSYYHHHRLFSMMGLYEDFKTFWNHFISGKIYWTPYFPQIKEAWEKRNHPNMLFLFYEELSKDLPAAVRRVAKFLEKPITEEQVLKLCDHLHIDNFRHNPSVNSEEMRVFGFMSPDETFIRKGKSGGWRSYFDEEMTEQAERWIEENLRDTDLRFPQKN